MKNKLLTIVLFLSFLPLLSFGNTNPKKDKYEKSKSLKKEYTVNANALVDIDNKYGNIDIVTWGENRVVIEVQITVSGNNESKVLAKLDEIDVDFEGSSSKVYAKTRINSRSNWSGSKNNNVNFQIDYKIKMPVTNSTKLDNDYGSISLNELKGQADINCDYGKIIIGELYHSHNKINIDYTNNSVIELMNGGEINADYSQLRVEKAKNISLNADYTNTVFEHIENLDFTCDYGKIEVENGNYIHGNGDYLTMRFGKIFKKLEITADYGGIRVEELAEGFELVKINSGYTGVKIGINSSASFDFNINTSYGGVSMDTANTNYLKKIVKSTSKYYQGYVNKESSGASVELSASYGSVKIYNN